MTEIDADLDNPFAAPQSDLVPEGARRDELRAASESLHGAGFAIRLLARVIDYGLAIVVTNVTHVIGILAAFAAGVIQSGDEYQSLVATTTGLSFVTSVLGSVLYHSTAETYGGVSLGKLIFGLRVVDESLGPRRFFRILGRSLAIYIDGFFFGIVAYSVMDNSQRNQRLGDEWGHTLVLRRRDLPEASRVSLTRMLLGVALGCTVWSATMFVPLAVAMVRALP